MNSDDPRERRWYRRRAQLKSAFESSESFDEMLKTFTKIEKSNLFKEEELGLQCWKMTLQLFSENQDPHKILSFGKRALQICISNDNTNSGQQHVNSTLAIACNLYILGSVSYTLNRYNESLSYLHWSERNLTKLELDNSVPAHILMSSVENTHSELFKVKMVLGKHDEAIPHAIKVLEIVEKIESEGCVKIGRANMDVADAYMAVFNFKEALPFALKGLGIYEKHFGNDSVELARRRWHLVIIYSGVQEFEKAWEQKLLCTSVLQKNAGSSDLLLGMEMEAAHVLLGLGRFEEGMDAFKAVISQANNQGAMDIKAGTFASMARACYLGKKYADAKKYIKLAKGIFEKKQINPVIVSTGLVDLSKLCEDMKDFRTAIALLLEALVIPEFPQDHVMCCSSRLFSMLSLNGSNETQVISQLEDVVERLKEKLGPEHSQVGYGYVRLGTAYMHSGNPGKAEKCFLLAKEIMAVSLGANHAHSLATSQSLSAIYAVMKRFDIAVEIQKKVVEGFEGLGPDEQDSLNRAVKLLKRMKVKASRNDYSWRQGIILLIFIIVFYLFKKFI